MKRMVYLQHVPYEPAAAIATWASSRGFDVDHVHVYRGDALPAHDAYDLLVVMGGPMNIYDDADHPWLPGERAFIRAAIEEGRHVLGVCLGAQLIADALGGRVIENPVREIGWFPVHHVDATDTPLAALPDGMDVLHWHGDTFDLPDGARWLVRSEACAHQAFCAGERVLGLQFHLEASMSMIRDWIDRSPFALGSTPTLQAPDEMLRDRNRFERGQAALNDVLDHFCRELLA